MRERLIELLKMSKIEFHKTCLRYSGTVESCDSCKYYHDDICDYCARSADHLLANGVVVLPEEDEGEEMRWDTVLKMLDEQYKKAKQESYVQKPMAYALRKVWLQVDRYEREKNRERRMKK